MPLGTFINMITVSLGSLIGLTLHQNFPPKMKQIVFQGLGLCTLFIGLQMSLQVKNPVVLIFSVIIGGIIGEFIQLDKQIDRISEVLKKRLGSTESTFTQGLVTAFLIFCIGSMSIIGSLNEGLSGNRSLLFTKSILDGFTSIALASTYGIGVLFSIVPMLVFQGSLTVFASLFQGLFTPLLLAQLTGTGGILILGISLNLLEIKKIRVINFLPALIIVIILTILLAHYM